MKTLCKDNTENAFKKINDISPATFPIVLQNLLQISQEAYCQGESFLINSWISTETELWISAGMMATDRQKVVSEVPRALYPVSDHSQGRMLGKHFNNSTHKNWCSPRYILVSFPSQKDPGLFIFFVYRNHPLLLLIF